MGRYRIRCSAVVPVSPQRLRANPGSNANVRIGDERPCPRPSSGLDLGSAIRELYLFWHRLRVVEKYSCKLVNSHVPVPGPCPFWFKNEEYTYHARKCRQPVAWTKVAILKFLTCRLFLGRVEKVATMGKQIWKKWVQWEWPQWDFTPEPYFWLK